MRHLSIALILLSSIPVQAAELGGYVVKADSGTIFLDLGATSGISVGQNFVVYTEGEELKHPITGASLGRVENQVGQGHIEQIQDKFSIGTFEPKSPDVKVSPGEKFRMLATFAAAPATVAAPTSTVVAPTAATVAPVPAAAWSQAVNEAAAGVQHAPIWKSPAMDFEAVGLAIGDIDGDGKPEIVLADASHVAAYPQTGDWKPVCEYDISATGSKVLSIDVADLGKKGKSDVFVTYYNGAFDRVETLVLQYKDKSFEKIETLPYMIRAFQDASGAVQLGAQQLIDDSTFPFGSIYTVAYKDGKYVTDKHVKANRVEWLYGFTLAKDAAGDSFPIYVTNTNHLRAQFKKKAWVSTEGYEQTASRLRWKDRDQLLMFRPRMISTQDKGIFNGLYLVDNQPALGAVGGAFGYFSDAKLLFMQWDGLALKPAWSTPSLGGYVADLAAVSGADGQPTELWAAVQSSGGRLSVQKFQP